MAEKNDIKCPKLEVAHRIETSSTPESANEALNIWKERPNLVNRRLCGCASFWEKTVKCPTGTPDNHMTLTTICTEIIKEITSQYSNLTDCNMKDLELNLKRLIQFCFGNEKVDEESNDEEIAINFMLRKLLPRSLHKFHITIELIVSRKTNGNNDSLLWFFPLFALKDEDNFVLTSHSKEHPWLTSLSYGFSYEQLEEKKGSMKLLVTSEFQDGIVPSSILCANLSWLKDTLMQKLKNWSENFVGDGVKSNEKKLQSLSLVDVEEYMKVYNRMKAKYAQPLCDSWQENTDPQKFVFEDISIASYLIVLWEEDIRQNMAEKKQSFIDLGCGNGLLVYLLSQEGYEGQGIDIRKRNIWDTFGEGTSLVESSLHPNNCKFEDADWLLGNHSDELTPWIPVIAARSSYKTNYFVLPCCFHDFTRKFQKNCHDSSQYQTYLEYVKSIGEACGFTVEEDIQRIPSTKRTCHIGRKRVYSEIDHSAIDSRIQNYLDSQNCAVKLDEDQLIVQDDEATKNLDVTENTSVAFEPREAKEKVRNCTQVDKAVREEIVEIVSNALLQCGNQLGCDAESNTSKGMPCSQWNCGGSVPLEDLVSLLDANYLLKLKSQCGGLQTLLRNHGHIFKVVQGNVALRNYKETDNKFPRKRKRTGKAKCSNNFKKKLCWFHFHHPHGCLLPSTDCQFAHDDEEVRTSGGR